jgi:hypothetical protein
MKPVAIVCVVSLGLNAVLAGYLMKRPERAGRLIPAIANEAPAVARPTRGGGISEVTGAMLVAPGDADLETLRDRLRAEGLPEAIVRDLIEQKIRRAHRAELAAADPAGRRPWWQQFPERLPGDDVKLGRLERRQQLAFKQRVRELFPSADEEPLTAESAFLPEAQRRALQKVLGDYEDLNAKLSVESGNVSGYSEDAERFVFLREEREKDLQALLSPQDYAEFKLRDVWEQSSLKKTAALLNLTEEEFRGLLEINRRLGAALAGAGSGDDPFAPLSPEKQAIYNQAKAEDIRRKQALLGMDKLDLYQRAERGDFDAVERYVARFDLPPERVGDYFNLVRKMETEATGMAPLNGGIFSEERAMAELRVYIGKYEEELKRLMGPAVMESDVGLVRMLGPLKGL